MTIDEILTTNLTEAEKKAFKNLGASSDFRIAVSAIDNYILRLNAGLLIGTEVEKGSAADEFYRLKNFIYYWSKVVALTKEKEKDETKQV